MCLSEKLIELEKSLHTDEIRSSYERLNELLHNDFMEITQRGTTYGKKEALEGLSSSSQIEIKSANYQVKLLSSDIAQVIYETETTKFEEGVTRKARRSSLWKLEGDRWQMIFHQGTKKE